MIEVRHNCWGIRHDNFKLGEMQWYICYFTKEEDAEGIRDQCYPGYVVEKTLAWIRIHENPEEYTGPQIQPSRKFN